ncbi:MAG: hypothetical protein LV479_12645 [Methylacidiphilales bacterium]|nr:hypothetical protein [Candidatus Methylacidiphilales bacterium]
MSRCACFLLFAAVFSLGGWVAAHDDDGPAISITSPDLGTTFAFGTIKEHSLTWDKKKQMLMVHVTFTDAEENLGQPNDDQHVFRLPGVRYDEAKGVFYATSKKGETIPVAKIRQALFFKVVETTPNAVVRIQHPRGMITVIMEAISPNDPAMIQSPSDGDGTHQVDAGSVTQ